MLRDEPHRRVAEAVGDVALLGQRLAVLLDDLVRRRVLDREVAACALQQPVEPLESAPVRVVGGGVAQVPLADETRGVAEGLEPVGDGLLRELHPAVQVARRDVVLVSEAALVAPRHQTGARRRADAAGHVGIGEPDPGRGDGVDVGCERRQVRGRVRLEAEVGVPRVVREEDDDVGRARGLVGRHPRTDGAEQEEEGQREE